MEGYVQIGSIQKEALSIVQHMFEFHDIGTKTEASPDGRVELYANREHLVALREEQGLDMEIPA